MPSSLICLTLTFDDLLEIRQNKMQVMCLPFVVRHFQ
uniref:Uncharacterized protein n=1 Tax=Setaria italica TaxID=4555 RepID=K3XTW5_SETIT